MTNEEAKEQLKNGQKVWDIVHAAGGTLLDNTAGKKFLFLQGAAGSSVVDASTGDTWDEILVGLAGDYLLGGFVFKGMAKLDKIAIESSLIISEFTPGEILKQTYKDVKFGLTTEFFWDYVSNWDPTTEYTGFDDNTYNPIPYAKVQAYKDENGITQYHKTATGVYFEEISQQEYENFIATKNAELEELQQKNPDTVIEKQNGVLKVTLPTGEIIAEGDDGANVIEGGNKGDYLYGMGGTDILKGGQGNDHLEGGKGFDTYVAGNGDTIKDSDGEGLVKFDGIDLTGKKYKNSESGQYEDDDYIYEGDPDGKGPLVVTSKDGSKSITIQEWSNEDLGIELLDNKNIEVSITESATAGEGDSGKRYLSFTVTLSRALEDGESLDVSVSNTDEGSYTFTSGEQSHTFTHSWNGDTSDEGAIDHTATLTPSANYDGPYDDVAVTIKNSGTATVYDDDEDKRHDPLALDTNKDGFISTSDLETSGTYFDMTGLNAAA